MTDVIKNYGGAILFYIVVFFGVLAICGRANEVNHYEKINTETIAYQD